MSSTSRRKFFYRVITCEWQAVVGAGGGVSSILSEDSVGFVWEYYSPRVVETLEMSLCILGWALAVVYVAYNWTSACRSRSYTKSLPF
jgi:hypothetical protein